MSTEEDHDLNSRARRETVRGSFSGDTSEWTNFLSQLKPTLPKVVHSSRRTLCANFELGDFTIQRVIAKGSFGRVYGAIQNGTNREVALKILFNNDPLQENESNYLERFRRECETLAKLDRHKNIVTIYSAGVDKNTHLGYLAMELIEGQTLHDLEPATSQLEDILSMAVGVLDALSYAHAKDVRHRDVKPQNIIIPLEEIQNEDGTTSKTLVYANAKLVDFGIAKPLDRVDITQMGEGLGTLAYIAPEYAAHFLGNDTFFDNRVDVYALGIVLWEKITGIPVTDMYQPNTSKILKSTDDDVAMLRARKDLIVKPPSVVASDRLTEKVWKPQWDNAILSLTDRLQSRPTAAKARDKLYDVLAELKELKRKKQDDSSKARRLRLQVAPVPRHMVYDLDTIIDLARSNVSDAVFASRLEQAYGMEFLLLKESDWNQLQAAELNDLACEDSYFMFLQRASEDKSYSIGRAEQGTQIKIRGQKSNQSSRVHGRFAPSRSNRGCWTYTDLDSTNGTYLNSKLASPSSKILLKDSTLIKFGEDGECVRFCSTYGLRTFIGTGFQTRKYNVQTLKKALE